MHDTDWAGADAATSPLEFSSFATDELPAAEAQAIWRESISPMFESRPLGPDAFRGTIDACLLDGLVLAHAHASAQEFRRDRRMQRRDGVDHILVQFYQRGGYVGEHRGRPVNVAPGDVGILDLGAQTHTRDAAFESITLVVPRDRLQPLVGTVDCGGLVIRGQGALGRILTSHLAATWSNLLALSVRDAPYAARALLGVLAACIAAERGGRAGVAPDESATAVAIRDFIERHLARPDLGPDLLCQAFRCSRAYLYRLFAPMGGVHHHIQRRRLARCYRELIEPSRKRVQVTEVAMRWGFVNPSHFSRLFRTTYGLAPREALHAAGSLVRPTTAAARTAADLPAYHDWLLQLPSQRTGTPPYQSAAPAAAAGDSDDGGPKPAVKKL